MEDFYEFDTIAPIFDPTAPRRREEKSKQRTKNRKRNKASRKSRRK